MRREVRERERRRIAEKFEGEKVDDREEESEEEGGRRRVITGVIKV